MASNAPTATLSPEDAAKAARQAELEKRQAEANAENAKRSGKGTRVFAGMTRGKGTQVVSWEAFDDSKPDTLPTTYAEFSELTKVADEPTIVRLLIDGYNASQYAAASDPIGEFVEPTWSGDAQKQFRIVVRNYSNATGVSLEDAVALIKPGFDKAQSK
jgi:hypothetical protein